MRHDMDQCSNGKGHCLVVSANDKYMPYLAVLLASVKQCRTEGELLHVVILYSDISEENRSVILRQFQGNGMQIQFLDVTAQIGQYEFFVGGQNGQAYLSKETYYRLLSPWLLAEYDTALYLDSDVVVRPGWTQIYDRKLGEHLVAGIRDIWGNWQCHEHGTLEQYRREQIGMENPFDYFNAGVLLMNLQQFRKLYRREDLVKLATERAWQKHDQDVLNHVCRGQVLWMDYAWNMIECPSSRAWNTVSEREREEYEQCRMKPQIIHFASRKPWIVKGVQFEQDFWRAASETAYFDGILTDYIAEQLSQGTEFEKKVMESIRQGKIGIKFIARCLITWIKDGKKPKRKA